VVWWARLFLKSTPPQTKTKINKKKKKKKKQNKKKNQANKTVPGDSVVV
jgi:hypothetical protein